MTKARKKVDTARQRFERRRQTVAAPAQEIGVTEDARRWIAENLLLGAPVEQIVARLQQRGCPVGHALQEVQMAQNSPYLAGAAVLQQRLAKRDWILDSISRLGAIDGNLAAVPLADKLDADSFFRDYYSGHRPALISGLMDAWPALHLWSLDYFEDVLGDPDIEVQTRRESNASYELDSVSHKERMPLSQVLGQLRSAEQSNDFYVTANNGGVNRAALARLWEDVGPMPGYLDPEEANDGYFWMGPKGTVTPFHHDLTNNLLVQIRGRKRVTLVPSWDTPKMRNFKHCFSSWPSPEALAALPESERPTILTCIIEPGQSLFIPVGWWHYVEGLDFTIGMSFTNFLRINDFCSNYTCHGAL